MRQGLLRRACLGGNRAERRSNRFREAGKHSFLLSNLPFLFFHLISPFPLAAKNLTKQLISYGMGLRP
jgi:hypothetical protein